MVRPNPYATVLEYTYSLFLIGLTQIMGPDIMAMYVGGKKLACSSWQTYGVRLCANAAAI
jgi:hypothetical protein